MVRLFVSLGINLAAMTETTPSTTNELQPLRTIEEVAAMLRVSRSTSFRMKKAQSWPCIMLGSQTRFDEGDIKAIIDMNRQVPPPPKTIPNVGTRARRR